MSDSNSWIKVEGTGLVMDLFNISVSMKDMPRTLYKSLDNYVHTKHLINFRINFNE